MSTNSHPGLAFGVNGMRRFAGPHSNTPNKLSPALSQHPSPYQAQAYQQPQPPQAAYSHHHLFTSPTPTPVPNVGAVQNGSRQPPPQVQVAPPASAPRQRAPPQRQMQQQQQQQQQQQPTQPMNYLAQTLNQQSMNHQVQPNENSILMQQPPPQPQSQPTLPPQPPPPQQLPQVPQVQQVQQVQPVQPVQPIQQVSQVPLPQVRQQQSQPQAEPAAQTQDGRHEDDMDVENSGDDIDGNDSSLEPKLIDGTPYVPREPMGNMMSAPPEGGSYPTLEAVHKFVLSYCTSVGYAVVIGRSKKTVPGLKKVLFVCDRAGKPPRRVSPEMRKRKTSSRKCDCQFGFFAIEQRTQWTVRYRPDAQHLTHNHGPSESPLLHPAARKLDTKMVAAVKTLKENGVGVSQTLEILQNENPHVPLLPRDIYNARAAINRNPTKIASGLAEDRAAIYSKPHPTAEERIRADLRREISKLKEELDKVKVDSKKEIEQLKEQCREKDKMIEKFNMFIDICNQRVMVQREMLGDGNEGSTRAGNS